MNKLLATASAITLGVIASQAHADNGDRWPRWYLGLNGGVGFLSDTDIKGNATGGKVEYNTGFSGSVALGYMPPLPGPFLSNLRAEAELGYHYNSLDKATGVTSANGSTSDVSYMGNLYYDFNNASPWTPYVGAGAGGARVSLSKSSGLANTDSTDSVFAYQFLAGIAYSPTTMPNTMWSLGYRYFTADSPSFRTATGSVKLDNQIVQSAEVGAKFRF